MLTKILIIVMIVGNEMVTFVGSALLEQMLAEKNFCHWSVKLKFLLNFSGFCFENDSKTSIKLQNFTEAKLSLFSFCFVNPFQANVVFLFPLQTVKTISSFQEVYKG